MLAGISIRNLVLIDRLDLQIGPGLTVLTGETGAGKSILLDALGLATGARADSAMVRKGCDQAIASAEFSVPPAHPAISLLTDQGIDATDGIILRRVIGADGRSRAFVNDQAISIGLLRTVGDLLIEVHGQNDDRGLLNTSGHRALLDAFGDLGADLARCRAAHREMQQSGAALSQARTDLEKAQIEEDYLRHVLNELEMLAPKTGEEAELAAARTLMMSSEKLTQEMNAALEDLGGHGRGAEALLSSALRRLERIADTSVGRLDAALGALASATSDAMEARAQLELALSNMEFNPDQLETSEARLFALRAAARKHHVTVDALPDLQARIAGELGLIDAGTSRLEELEKQHAASLAAYDALAARLHAARTECAVRLDRAVKKELAPLKLDKAIFKTAISPLGGTERGADGTDRVEFQVATNPGADPGALIKIASGGELSRFMLALRMVLAKSANGRAMVFDEVDSAVGGAVADAIGDRLARLATGAQVLVVTHSPQVAARGATHWRVQKRTISKGGAATTTSVEVLDVTARREEIARMLAGAEVTDAARAAADSLMTAGARR
ncbi:MAG: DNA repair protein RecN [Alphaproteobacteria bacterium]|nr:DNA repair protein RecN [Alphaproteobacteria bacterium]